MFPGPRRFLRRPFHEPLRNRESRRTPRLSRLLRRLSRVRRPQARRRRPTEAPRAARLCRCIPSCAPRPTASFGVFTAAEAAAARATSTPRSSSLTRVRTLGAAAARRLRRPPTTSSARGATDGRASTCDCLCRPARPRPAPRGGQPRVRRAAVGPARPHGQRPTPIRLTDPDSMATRATAYVMSRAPLSDGRGLAQRAGAPHVRGAHARRLRPRVAARGRRRRHGRRPARRADDARRARGRGRGGPRTGPALRRAAGRVALADGRAESPLETRGGCGSSGPGFPTPELQVEIRAGGPAGRASSTRGSTTPAVAVEFDGRVKYTDPWRGRSPERVLWEEKRREDELRAARHPRRPRRRRRPRAADGPTSRRGCGRLLGAPGPAVRRFTATPRAHGVRRTG